MSIKPLQAKISKIDGLLDRLEVELQNASADTSSEVSNITFKNRYAKSQMAGTIAQASKRSAKKSVKTQHKTY